MSVEIRPRYASRYLALAARALRGGGQIALRGMLRRGRCTWPWSARGAYLLARWSGERLPTPTLDPWGGRVAEIVGWAAGGAVQIASHADVAWSPGTVYHLAVVAVGHGGEPAAIDPTRVVTRVIDAGGGLVPPLPNAPAAVAVTLAAGGVPVVSWAHSRAREAAAAARFAVYVSSGAAFDFAAPAAMVERVDGVTRYRWRGAALSAGDERWYCVRAVAADGTLSLIPRSGLCPSGSYTSVDLGHVPKVVVPPAPSAAVAAMHLEGGV